MFTVYAIDCPDHDGGICEGGDVYIGQTVSLKSRIAKHAYNKRCCPKLSNWLKKRRSEGLAIRVIELAEVSTREEAHALERKLISKLRPACKLLNLTDGGEGTSGSKRSQAAIDAARSKQLGSLHPNAKLNDRKVRLMRTMFANGASSTIVAKIFGVSQQLASDIRLGKKWKEPDAAVDIPKQL